MYILISIALILFTWIYFYYKEKYNFWSKLEIKHVKPTFPFGSFTKNTLGLRSIPDIVDDMYKTYKNERYFGIYQLSVPILVITDPELIKRITIKDFDHFVNHHSSANEEIDKMWSKTVFAMIGEPWRKMRSTLSPAFTGNKMRYMFPLMDCVAENMVKSLKKKQGLIKLEMKDMFSKVTNDTIASCALGINCNSIDDPKNEFYRIGTKGIDFSGLKRLKFFLYNSYPGIMKFFGIKMFKQEYADLFDELINETIKAREENGLVRNDLINLLLEARKSEDKDGLTFKEYLTNDYIAAQAGIFYFGGFDTTATLMSFLAYNLATHPDVQKRLINDIDKALQGNNGVMTYEVVKNIKYLDLVFNETIRLYSPAIFLDRVCTKEYTIEPVNQSEKPLVIKQGQALWIPSYSIHRDSTYFEKPYEFNPDRIIDQNSPILGFGSGPRFCIGQRFAVAESKTIICHLLKNFEIVTTEKTQIPLKLSITDIILTAEKGVWVGLKNRN